jgi:multidrug efflux pump subunit AcrA (membrane-fusion protein)
LRPICPGGLRVALAAFAAWVLTAGCQQEDPATAATKKSGAAATVTAPARAVRVVPAAETTVARTVSATGTLAADEQIALGTKIVGRLAEISVDLGSVVKRGQPVARIDATDYQHRLDQAVAALRQARVRLGLPAAGDDDHVDLTQTAVVRQAKALLDQAQLNRDRMARLWEQQLVARAELDAAVSALQVADGRYQDALEEVQNRQGMLLQRRSEVELARQQVADTVLLSPIDGAVAERQASVGEFLNAGAPVVTLVRLHPLRLRLSVPEREAASIRRASRCA